MSAGDDEGDEAPDARVRDVLRRVVRLLGGERKLLDAEEEPHREGEREQDAAPAERQELELPATSGAMSHSFAKSTAPFANARMPKNTRMPIEMIDDDDREAERDRRAGGVERDEDDVEDDPPHPEVSGRGEVERR